MIEALAIIGGISTPALAIAFVVLAFKSLSAKDGQLVDRDKARESDKRADAAVKERDLEVEANAKLRAEKSDLLLAKSQVESERNALTAEVARLKIKLAASLPVGDEGAAVTNDEFSKPLLSASERDGLEKP